MTGNSAAHHSRKTPYEWRRAKGPAIFYGGEGYQGPRVAPKDVAFFFWRLGFSGFKSAHAAREEGLFLFFGIAGHGLVRPYKGDVRKNALGLALDSCGDDGRRVER